MDRSRHQSRCFVAGETEHDALVAGTFILISGSIDALGDVNRLSVQKNRNIGVAPVKTILFVSDVAHRRAGDVFHLLGIESIRTTHLARKDDTVRSR